MTVTDEFGSTGTDTATLTINSLNTPPVANDDLYNVNENGNLVVAALDGVLTNDTDSENDPMTAILVNGPAYGDLNLDEDGSFTYTPSPNFHGTDTFTYKASDGTAESDPATVTITVIPIEYTLTVNTNGHGTVTKEPENDTYHYGDMVTLTAEAEAGWTFNSWGGDLEGNTNPRLITIEGDMNVDANFDPPIQRFHAQLTQNSVDGYDWTLGQEITVTIDEASNGVGVDFTDTKTVQTAEWDPTSTVVHFTDLGGIDLEAGDYITMTNGTITKTLTVSVLTLDGVDIDTDTVFGTAAPGANLTVQGLCYGNQCAERQVIAMGGNWLADFSVPDEDKFNIKQGTTGEVIEPDEDGDHTDIDWGVFNPVLTAHPDEDLVDGTFWPLGVSVTLDINNGEHTASETVLVAPWNSSETYVEFNLAGIHDLVPGDVVTLTHGTITKTHTVFDLDVTNMNATGNTVSGTTNQPYDIQLWVHPGVDGSFVTVPVTVGTWTADFSPFDLIPGNAGPALQSEDDGDGTWVEWWMPYTLTLDKIGDGNVVADPLGLSYRPDSEVQLTANPAVGWIFSGWSGDLVSTDNPAAIIMNADKTVIATFTEINTAPVAVNDTYTTDRNVTLNVAVPGVLGNDTDVDLDALTAIKIDDPLHGTLTFNTNGSFIYIPETGFTGDDTFTYKAFDAVDESNTATVTIHVNEDTPPPPVPSSFHGEIHFFDSPPLAGVDTVQVFVPGIVDPSATATIGTDGSILFYALNVPGDIVGTPTKEGGLENETLTFKINGRMVATAVWHGGTSVQLNLHPPQALPGGPYTGTAGVPISFSGSANDYGNDASTYQWDWENDGTYDTTGQTASHAWANPGSYTVGLKVTDAQNGVGTATVPVTVILSTHSISLVQGWNLVSFNVRPTNTDITAVLSSISGNYNLVYAWDATITSDNWKKYAPPPAPSYQNTLSSLDETMGFWIYMTTADTLEVVGTATTTTDIALSVNAGGWNLVGYPSMAERDLPGALQSHGVGTDFSLVYAYHAYDTEDQWKLFDRTGASYANDLKKLTPGWGYWIKVSADHIWSVKYLSD